MVSVLRARRHKRKAQRRKKSCSRHGRNLRTKRTSKAGAGLAHCRWKKSKHAKRKAKRDPAMRKKFLAMVGAKKKKKKSSSVPLALRRLL